MTEYSYSRTAQDLVVTKEKITSLDNYCIAKKSFDTKKLVQENPSKIRHPHKKLLLELACNGVDHSGTLEFSRFTSIPLPDAFPANAPVFVEKMDSFDYARVDPSATEWWLNFADSDLFVAYRESLFAQDEIQVAEMPSLGYMKEALLNIHKEQPTFRPLTRAGGRPTPILISGIERKCHVKLNKNAQEGRPNGLYGNVFATVSETAIRKATTQLNPPMIVNMIAMAALSPGYGRYTQNEIIDLYTTAYTSFVAAKLSSPKGTKVIIHTGNWGTGAFGGSKPLVCVIQLAAAHHAEIDQLYYHTFDAIGSKGYAEGLKLYQKLNVNSLSTRDFLTKLYELKFAWGVSDGN